MRLPVSSICDLGFRVGSSVPWFHLFLPGLSEEKGLGFRGRLMGLGCMCASQNRKV